MRPGNYSGKWSLFDVPGRRCRSKFSYNGLRHWNMGANGSYSRLGALAQNVGTYDGYQAGLGVTRDLARGLQVVFRVDERRYATNFAGFNRNSSQVSLGFAWSPGDVPLKLW